MVATLTQKGRYVAGVLRSPPCGISTHDRGEDAALTTVGAVKPEISEPSNRKPTHWVGAEPLSGECGRYSRAWPIYVVPGGVPA